MINYEKLHKVLITSLLGIRSDRRFRRILNISRNLKHGGAAIVEKLAYFKDMNIYLTTILFFYAISLGILCVDGLTEAKTINSNKFASDLLIANCNTASVLMWIVGVSLELIVNYVNDTYNNTCLDFNFPPSPF